MTLIDRGEPGNQPDPSMSQTNNQSRIILAKFQCENCPVTASVPQWTTIPHCLNCMTDMKFIEDIEVTA
jgi:hypothetical protein